MSPPLGRPDQDSAGRLKVILLRLAFKKYCKPDCAAPSPPYNCGELGRCLLERFLNMILFRTLKRMIHPLLPMQEFLSGSIKLSSLSLYHGRRNAWKPSSLVKLNESQGGRTFWGGIGGKGKSNSKAKQRWISALVSGWSENAPRWDF